MGDLLLFFFCVVYLDGFVVKTQIELGTSCCVLGGCEKNTWACHQQPHSVHAFVHHVLQQNRGNMHMMHTNYHVLQNVTNATQASS